MPASLSLLGCSALSHPRGTSAFIAYSGGAGLSESTQIQGLPEAF